MSSHAVTIAGYLLFLALGIALTVLADRPGSRIPTLSALFVWSCPAWPHRATN